MSPSDRLSRADRAKAALTEFLEPAFEHVEKEWLEQLIAVTVSSDPRATERQVRFTAAIKAIRVVRAQIEAIVADGRLAEADMKREAQISRMSDHKRSVVGV